MTRLAIIGGGIMGSYIAKALAPKIEIVSIYDKKLASGMDFRKELEESLRGVPYEIACTPQWAVKNADFVGFCVPTEVVYEVMLQTLPFCKKGAIIFGQTSRKTPEAEAFDRYVARNRNSGLELVTIHTPCNPSISDPRKTYLAVVRHNPQNNPAYESKFGRALQFFEGMPDHFNIFESVEEHDVKFANTQIVVSWLNSSIASSIAETGHYPWINENYGSGFDVMKFSYAMRAARQKAELYRDMWIGSEHGKILVSQAVAVEEELYKMAVGNRRKEYRDRGLAAKKSLFGEKKLEPILSEESVKVFLRNSKIRPNSHFPQYLWAVASADRGVDLFADLKATTPNHTSMLCLVDYLFNAEGVLEEAMAAPFEDPGIRADDLVFHDQLHGWANPILFNNRAMYDSKHARMRGKLDDRVIQEGVEISKKAEPIFSESMKKAIDSGRFKR
ncbi:NAD(P)-binding domain-containing protein [Candidatus Woesearchaeota archaeon]|nr:NAD(P)-binding domain-containing protein [Candidatus Woesearchaeota archaeon]